MSTALHPVRPKTPRAASAAPSRVARTGIVDELNRDYALILLGDRPVVLHEGPGPEGRDEIRLLSVSGFHEWMRPAVTFVPKDDGTYQKLQKSKVWADSSERRQYNGLVFDPACVAPASYYNLWKGFAVEPAPPDSPASCAKFLMHVADNICAGNEALFYWVMGWAASLFQHPTRKLGTSLVLRGSQGSGKTKFGEVIGSLLGQHYSLIADQQRLVGRFNSHLSNCLLLQLDEATWGGNHDAAGKLKDLITSDYQYIEYKGREPVKVRNYVRLLITGNNSWLVPAGVEERRFAVLDVGDGARQNAPYFRAIDDEMDQGGREALLRYLLSMDLSQIPLRTIPNTAALAEQKVASLSPEQHWWLDILSRGVLPGDVLGEGEVECDRLYTDYIAHAHRAGVNRKSAQTQLGYALKRMVPGIERVRRSIATVAGPARRVYRYVFPSLPVCRLEFDRLTGDAAGWGDDAASTWQAAHEP